MKVTIMRVRNIQRTQSVYVDSEEWLEADQERKEDLLAFGPSSRDETVIQEDTIFYKEHNNFNRAPIEYQMGFEL